MAGHLELRTEIGGLRYYLDGEAIHMGELLEMLQEDGSWEVVRFEWTCRANDIPSLCVDDDRAIDLTDSMQFRWIRRELIK